MELRKRSSLTGVKFLSLGLFVSMLFACTGREEPTPVDEQTGAATEATGNQSSPASSGAEAAKESPGGEAAAGTAGTGAAGQASASIWETPIEQVKEISFEKKDEFRSAVEKNLQKVDTSIQELQTRSKDLPADKQKDVNKELAEMRTKRTETESKMKAFDVVTQANWNDFKSDVTDTMKDIEESYDQATVAMFK